MEKDDDCPGGTVYRFAYKPGVESDGRAVAEFVGEGVATPQAVSGAALVEFSRTPQGWDRKTRYLDVRGQPAADAEGSYGQMVEQFTDNGLPLSVINLGADGFPAVHRDGYVRAEMSYDAQGRTDWLRFGDQQGRPTLTRFGFSSVQARYDAYGNVSEIWLFDPAGQPMAPVARLAMTYDRHGNLLRTAALDADGTPARHPEGWSAVAQEYAPREKQPGRAVSLFLLDPDDQPVTITGFAGIVQAYDEAGNLVSQRYIDAKRQKVGDPAGVSQIEYGYRHGKLTEVTYLNADGERTVPLDRGYATLLRSYDAEGRSREESYLDTEGEPTRDAQGVLRRRFSYDDDGHLVKTTYLEPGGERMRSWRGEAEVQSWYDDERGLSYEGYKDVDGSPVAVPWIEVDGERFQVPGGCAFAGVRERLGKVVELVCLDRDDEPVAIDGCLRTTFRYDAVGREVERACRDAADNLVPFARGFGGWRTSWNARGKRIGWSFFSSRDPMAPAPVQGDVTGLRWSYDDLGNKVAESYVDEAGQPTRHPDGYSRVEIAYDAWGRPIEKRYLGPDGETLCSAQGFARETFRYGRRGELLERKYHNENGGAASNGAGYARATYAYSPRGEPTEVRYFDATNRPMPRGTAAVRMAYRDDGSRTDQRLDASGRELRTETARRSDPVPEPNSPYRNPPTADPRPPPPPKEPLDAGGAGSTGQSAETGTGGGSGILSPEPLPSGDLGAAIERLAVVAEDIVDSYEDFLDDQDRGPEGREGAIPDSLEELYDNALELRKAYRRATGQSRGFGAVLGAIKERMGVDQTAQVRKLAETTLRTGDTLAPLMAEYPVGARAGAQWREIQSLLAKVRAELR